MRVRWKTGNCPSRSAFYDFEYAADNVDHLGYLLPLCELELIDRERRAAERRLNAAKFPTHKTLETFDFPAQPSVNHLLVTELMRGEYLDKRENILLVGNSGTGNSYRLRDTQRHRGKTLERPGEFSEGIKTQTFVRASSHIRAKPLHKALRFCSAGRYVS